MRVSGRACGDGQQDVVNMFGCHTDSIAYVGQLTIETTAGIRAASQGNGTGFAIRFLCGRCQVISIHEEQL